MEHLQSRRLEALSAYIEGLETALAVPAEGNEKALPSLRRLTRSLARAADDLALPEVASLAREVRARSDAELPSAARGLVETLRRLRPGERGPRPRHIMVVEDDRTLATAVLACLKAEGTVLHLADTAAAAEGILSEHPVDLVVLDLILPDRDGRDLLLQLREDPATASVPVIVLSARAAAATRSECLAVGASEFLEKPADPKLLCSAASLLLDGRRREADARRDTATGLLSRAGLAEAFAMSRSRDGKVEGPLAVVLLCVPDFDRVRRELGRDQADALLRSVAEPLRPALGPRDRLGRWSEAELLALLPGTSVPDARAMLDDGLRRLAAAGLPEPLRQVGIEASLTVGITVAQSGCELREAAVIAQQAALPVRRTEAGFAVAPPSPEPEEKLRVLLVEDDRVIATLIQHRLVREGFDVMDFLNGEDAFLWASRGSFDLAILDVKVPGRDGFEILERLRADPRHAGVPIIMLTGLGGEADVVRGFELGASDYMMKPFSPAELLARVRRFANEAAQARGRIALPGGSDRGTEASAR